MAPLAEPNIIALEIVIGVPRAPGDPFTNEPELQVINLLDATRGLALEYPDGWTPQMPSMKNGGLWADSALSAGRQLIAGENGNVIETMTIHASGATMENRLYLKSQLLAFARRAKAFHTDWAEQQPVYLKWHAPNAPCAQYAILYSIDVADEGDAFDTYPADTMVITLEREPAWRMFVPPGGNPIEWSYFANNKQRGVDYSYGTMGLDSTNSLVTGTVNNRHEWTYNGGSPVTTPTSKNYVEISADKIPGDAPALVCAALHFTPPDGSTDALRRVLMWHSSKELTGVDQVAGTAMAAGYIMNACDMISTGTPTAGTARTGVFNIAAVPARRFLSMVLVGTGSAVEALSGDASSTSVSFWFRQLMRGRYAVFVRATALTGVASDIRLTVKVEEWNTQNNPLDGSQAQIVLPTVNIPVNGAGNYALVYAGQVTIPFEAKSEVGIDGRGLYLKKFVNNVTPIDLRLKFRFENFTNPTNSRTVHMLDAILVPMDEAFADYLNTDTAGTANSQIHVMDNTGYLSRGKTDEICGRTVNNGSFSLIKPVTVLEQRGNMPVLLPRKTQRLYFLNVGGVSGGALYSAPDADMTVFINIVPRCYGVAAL